MAGVPQEVQQGAFRRRILAGRGVALAAPADPTTPWTLVRPDAHVAWRGGPTELGAALDRAGLTPEARV